MKPYFSGIKVGDKIWTIQGGEVIVKELDIDHTQVILGGDKWYTLEGKFHENDLHQSAFWIDPKIVAPERPTPKTLDEEFDEMWQDTQQQWSTVGGRGADPKRMLRWVLHRAVEETRK